MRNHNFYYPHHLLTSLLLTMLLSLSIAPVFSQVNPKEGLLIWYPFHGSAADSSGNGKNGTVNGTSLATDRFGNANSAFFFDGLDDYIDVPAATLQNNQYSYSLWVNPKTIPYEETTVRVLSIGGPGGDQDVSLGNGYVAISKGWDGAGYNTDGTVSHCSVGNLPTIDIWYHITLTRDEAALKLYVNGQLAGTDLTNGKLPYYG